MEFEVKGPPASFAGESASSLMEEMRGEDRQKIGKLRAAGIIAFFQLIKNSRIHNLDNESVVKVLDILMSKIGQIIEDEGQYAIQISEGSFFVNKDRQQFSTIEEIEKVQWLEKEFLKFGIGGLTIFSHIEPKEFKVLLAALIEVKPGKMAISAVQRFLDLNEVTHIKVNKLLKHGTSTEKNVAVDARSFVYLAYAKVLILTKEYIANIGNTDKQVFFAKKLRKSVQSLVDACRENAHLVLGLSAVKNYSDFLPNHCVNVGVLSTAMGLKIGLDKKDLGELALCGIFHDIGTLFVRRDTASGKEVAGEKTDHLVKGILNLLSVGQFSESVLRRTIVIFEHHIGYDRSGYPQPAAEGRPDLFSRIVSIADGFDTLTIERSGAPAYLPDEALRVMMKDSGTFYDPVLLKVFVNMTGIYPLGTLVTLSTGEIGVVYQTTMSAKHANRPLVLLVRDRFGNEMKGKIVDLAETGPDGAFKRSIERSADPKKLNINIPHFLFG